ncbi:MAG: leucine-rich repeat domain-containing protein, partial [Erysipelotrichaceae bacterium]|nr:leucine-rich repeat domain-containing protein [Erysipelotrichaceae bacterium]
MKKRLLSMICAICTIFMLIPMSISAETFEDFYYSKSVINNEVAITGYKGTGGNVVIPAEIEGIPVTTIGNYAFQSTNLTSVTIPGSVKNIGTSAFQNCSSLSNVTIENGVNSIGTSAFQNCSSLTNITIPNSVESIGIAFNGCTSLTNIQVEALNSVYSSVDGILFNRNQTELIRCPQGIAEASYSIPGTVTSIGNHAFFGCDKLTNITIPNSVTSIGNFAFYYCKFTSITIPNSVTSIENCAFGDCKFTSITIPNSVTFIGSNVFENCINLVSIFLPDNLNIGHVVIPLETTQVRYSIDKDQVTITEITLGLEKSSVDIPATICGYPVVAVNSDYQKFVGDHKHYYVWTVQDGKYSGKCGICSKTIEEKDIPAIVINAPDQVCRTQDTVVSVSLPEGLKNATLYHEFSHSGGEIDLEASDGLNGKVSHESYPGEENSLKFVVYAKTSDGFEFTVTKTVEILDNHILEHISAKDATASKEGNIEYWTCKGCEKYFSDKDGENEIELKDTVVSRKSPEIIEGKGQSVNQGEKKSLSFTSNAPFNEFKYVKLDGNVLDSKNYTVKEGSTIVTLNKDFVSTLKAGKHILTIVSETGEASVEF